MLLDTPEMVFKTRPTLNPAALTPGSDHRTSLEQNRVEVIDLVYSSRSGLKDSPMDHADDNWLTDGSSFIEKGVRKAGYALVGLTQTIEAKALPANMSAQRPEAMALTRALQSAEGLKIDICTDSNYAILVLHEHGAIWKEGHDKS